MANSTNSGLRIRAIFLCQDILDETYDSMDQVPDFLLRCQNDWQQTDYGWEVYLRQNCFDCVRKLVAMSED